MNPGENFVELVNAVDLRIDLRYAGLNNFAGVNFYKDFNRCYVHKDCAVKFSVARRELARLRPDFKFVIYDALRPRSVQRHLWSLVVGTEGEKYFANPDVGSVHNYGFAIDLSLLDRNGFELDMGAGFDDFREIAQPRFEERFLAEGALTRVQLENRLLLRSVMVAAGFIQLAHEWWHFDALPKDLVRASYSVVE